MQFTWIYRGTGSHPDEICHFSLLTGPEIRGSVARRAAVSDGRNERRRVIASAAAAAAGVWCRSAFWSVAERGNGCRRFRPLENAGNIALGSDSSSSTVHDGGRISIIWRGFIFFSYIANTIVNILLIVRLIKKYQFVIIIIAAPPVLSPSNSSSLQQQQQLLLVTCVITPHAAFIGFVAIDRDSINSRSNSLWLPFYIHIVFLQQVDNYR